MTTTRHGQVPGVAGCDRTRPGASPVSLPSAITCRPLTSSCSTPRGQDAWMDVIGPGRKAIRIEHHHIGEISIAQIAGLFEAKDVGAQPRGASNEITHGDDVIEFDVLGILLRKGRVLAGMAVASVRIGDHPGLLHEQIDVVLAHVERRDAVGGRRRALLAGAFAAEDPRLAMQAAGSESNRPAQKW